VCLCRQDHRGASRIPESSFGAGDVRCLSKDQEPIVDGFGRQTMEPGESTIAPQPPMSPPTMPDQLAVSLERLQRGLDLVKPGAAYVWFLRERHSRVDFIESGPGRRRLETPRTERESESVVGQVQK
jgi:hypothetical protein